METALLLVFVLITLALATITALKGKWSMLALGLVFWPAWLLGSIRGTP